jgi:hypothetical protein
LRALADLDSQEICLRIYGPEVQRFNVALIKRQLILQSQYDGPVAPEAIFDPSRLSGASVQVKFDLAGDPQAESRIRPFGIPCDPHHPLPYLALLMELGNESNYQGHSKESSQRHPDPLLGNSRS